QATSGQFGVELVLWPVIDERGDYWSGQHRSDPQTVLDQLTPRRVNEGLDRVLGGRVDWLPDDRNNASNRACHHDIARLAFDPVRQYGMDRAEHRVDVQIEHPMPRIRISVDEFAADIRAGISMENIEMARGLEDVRHYARDRCR